MLKLQRHNEVPPGGFRYFVKETNQMIKESSWEDLVSKVRGHMAANHVEPPENLRELIEHQLCEVLPPGYCMNGGKVHMNGVKPLTWDQVKRGTLTLVAWFASGKKKVDQSVAEVRAKTCSQCQYNQPIDGCSSCNQGAIREMVNRIVDGGRTQADSLLQACALCGCSNKAQIWLEKDLLMKHMDEKTTEQLPEWCWKKPPTPH